MNIKWIVTIVFLGLMVGNLYASDEALTTNGVTQQLNGFNLNGYDHAGKKSWEINGAKADINDDKINVTDVDANFYGKENANLKSKTGTINKTTGEVNLNKDVVMTSDRGTTMTTDNLQWKRNEDLVTTKDVVQIDDEQGTVTGTGLTAHPDLKKAQLNQDVKAVIKTSAKKNAQTIEITSDGSMQMDQVRMYAVFNTNVIATEASTGRQLYADKMEAWFDDKNKKIKKLVCTGNVKVIQGDNASYAERMVYNGEDQTLTMTGRPKLVFETADASGSGMFQQLGN